MICAQEMASRARGAKESMLPVKYIFIAGSYRAKVRAPNKGLNQMVASLPLVSPGVRQVMGRRSKVL
jgi:hypothetical protein